MIYGIQRFTKFTKKGVQRGKTSYTKKAMIQLVEGDQIDLYTSI